MANDPREEQKQRRAAMGQQAAELAAKAAAASAKPSTPMPTTAGPLKGAGDWLKKKGGEISQYYKEFKESRPVLVAALRIAVLPLWVGFHVAKNLGKGYIWAWNKTTFKKDKETGKRKFSIKRGAVAALFTAVAATNFAPGEWGQTVRYWTGEPLYDAFRMATSFKSKEKLYLSDSQERVQDTHTVRGCRTQNCTTKEAVFFQTRPRLANQVWNLAVNGNPMFIPDHVVGPVVPGVNECEVTSYGFRWRMLQRLQEYPEMLSANCRNLSAFGTHWNGEAPKPRSAAPQ